MTESVVFASPAARSDAALPAAASYRPAELGRWALRVGVLAAVYFGSAKLGFALSFAGPVAAIVWLPVGVAVAFLSLFGLRYWPGALIGDLLANDYGALPLGGALGQTTGNMVEVLLAAWLIRRVMRSGSPLDRAPRVVMLIGSIAAGTLVSALVGPLSLRLSGAVSAGTLLSVMRTWWLGDFCGALVVVPLALAWRRLSGSRLAPARLVEAGALLAIVGAASAVAGSSTEEALTYLILPVLAWTVFRFGVKVGTLAVLVTVSVTIWTTVHVHGPYDTHSLTHFVLSTQLFIFVAAVSALFFAAVMTERDVLVERLWESREQIIRAAEAERRRLEHDLHDGAQQRLLALAARLGLAAERDGVLRRAALANAERELQAAIDELRELSHGLYPSELSHLGLVGAARSIAARSAVPVTLVELPSLRLDPAAETAAYFVLTEALANVQKYARASGVRVSIRYRAPRLQIVVSDDGAGGAHERPGSGLVGLRERVEGLHGEFAVSSSWRGTTVSAQIPAVPA